MFSFANFDENGHNPCWARWVWCLNCIFVFFCWFNNSLMLNVDVIVHATLYFICELWLSCWSILYPEPHKKTHICRASESGILVDAILYLFIQPVVWLSYLAQKFCVLIATGLNNNTTNLYLFFFLFRLYLSKISDLHFVLEQIFHNGQQSPLKSNSNEKCRIIKKKTTKNKNTSSLLERAVFIFFFGFVFSK